MLSVHMEVSAVQDNDPHDGMWFNKDHALIMINSILLNSIFK